MTQRLLFLTTLLLVCIAAPAIGWAAEEAGGHASPGIREDLALWSLVASALFFATCFKLLGPWAADSMKERERTENAYIDEALQKNRLAQEALSARRGQMEAIGEEIDERIAEAHRDAERTRNDIDTAAGQEADVLRNRALGEIRRTRDQALNELFSSMAALVVEQTEKKLQERLDDREHERLIDEALNHFATS